MIEILAKDLMALMFYCMSIIICSFFVYEFFHNNNYVGHNIWALVIGIPFTIVVLLIGTNIQFSWLIIK